jgi:antitoxin (DNA-binding transcriptional repressor) of toxin-antitoxin stability system
MTESPKFAIALFTLLWTLGVQAQEEERLAWEQPFELTLPEPTRAITLDTGTDPTAFLAEQGLAAARVVPLGRSGSLVELAMDEDQWQTVSDQVCGLPGVSACETVACQGIQLAGSAEPGSQYSAAAVQARLVQNAPEGSSIPDAPEGEAGTCKGPPLIPPLDQAAASGAGQNLTIDLSQISEISGSESGAGSTSEGSASGAGSDAAEEVADAVPGLAEAPSVAEGEPMTADTGAASTDAGQRGFRFSLDSGFNPAGGVDLGTDRLPEDTTDWTLVVGAGCTEVKVPLSAIEPARMPGMVVALVDTANVAPVAQTYGLTVVRQLALPSTGQNLAVYATAQNIFTVIALMAADVRVDGAQPEFIFETTADFAATGGAAGPATGYADPFAALTYGPAMTGALDLHGDSTGKGQLIAVIDTGIDETHPELAGRLREPVDTTGEGHEAEMHGTAVATIIAAEAGNAIGSFGVAPQAEILPIKACHPKEPGGLAARCTTSSLVKALDVAATEEAVIVNMSLAGPPDDLVARFVALLVADDRLIVAGAGNGGEHGKPGFPAALPGVLAVTAVDVADQPYEMANRGTYIDVAAPGVDIVSAVPGGLYPPLSGTSMAAAHVTGVAALIRELTPTIGARELGVLLKGNARDLGEPGIDELFGTGLVDACGTASAATAMSVTCGQGDSDEDLLSF